MKSRKPDISSMKKSPHVPLRQISEEKRRGKELGDFGFYYESMKRKLKIKPIYECRCEHLKIKARLTNEKFASVKGECEI